MESDFRTYFCNQEDYRGPLLRIFNFMPISKNNLVTNMKSKKISKTAKKRRANRKNRLETTIISGLREPMMSESSTAASYDITLKNPMRFDIVGKGLYHSEYGNAVRCVGMQQWLGVATNSISAGLLLGTSSGYVGSVNSGNSALLNPGALNDRVGWLASLYTRYAFRKVKVHYITRVGSTQIGSFSLAYSNDSGTYNASQGITENFGNIQSYDQCIVVPFRVAHACLEFAYGGTRTWYTTYDAGSSITEAFRQCIQGIFYGFPDFGAMGAMVMGEMYIEYEIDFYTPSPLNTNVPLNSLFNGCGEELSTILALARKKEGPERQELFSKFKSYLQLFLSI